MSIDITAAILAAIAYCVFIIYTRKSKTFEQYSVANRSVGFFLLFCSLSANFIGPGFTLGLTQKGYESGYFYLFIAGAYGVGKIIEGLVLAPKLKNKFTTALSIGDVVAGTNSHNSKILQVIVGTISFCLLVGLSVVMSTAAGSILNNFLGIPKILGTIIITCIVTGYSVFGGLRSTMMTDTLQLIAFIVLLPLLAIIILSTGDIDYEKFKYTSMSLTTQGFDQMPNTIIFGTILTWMFGETLMPFTVHTILAGQNDRIARKSLVYSGLLMVIWLFFMLTLGVMAKVTMPEIAANDQVLLHLGEKYYIGGLFGLFTVAVVGVVMSSQDALINCASVVFVKDIVNVLRPLDSKSHLNLSKIAGITVGLLSIIFASYVPSIINGLLFFYSIWIPSVLVVTVFAIFIENPSKIAAITALFIGAGTSILWNFTVWKDSVPNVLIGLLLSSIAYLIINTFKRKASYNNNLNC